MSYFVVGDTELDTLTPVGRLPPPIVKLVIFPELSYAARLGANG